MFHFLKFLIALNVVLLLEVLDETTLSVASAAREGMMA